MGGHASVEVSLSFSALFPLGVCAGAGAEGGNGVDLGGAEAGEDAEGGGVSEVGAEERLVWVLPRAGSRRVELPSAACVHVHVHRRCLPWL